MLHNPLSLPLVQVSRLSEIILLGFVSSFPGELLSSRVVGSPVGVSFIH